MRRRTASHCTFRQIGTSNGQLRVASPKAPALSSITGKFDPYIVLGDTSRAGQSHRAYTGGPGAHPTLRVSPRAHPTLLVSPSTKRMFAVMVDVFTVRISEAPGGEYRLLEVPVCEYAMRGGPPPHPGLLRSPSTKKGSTCPASALNAGAFGPALRTRRIEGPNLRMRNGRRSATASRSTRVPQHQVGLRGHVVHCHQT